MVLNGLSDHIQAGSTKDRALLLAKARLEAEFTAGLPLYDYDPDDASDRETGPIWWIVQSVEIRRGRGVQPRINIKCVWLCFFE